MREAARGWARREFLRRAIEAVAATTGVLALGPDVLEALERAAPRPLLVPGADTRPFVLDVWRGVRFELTDAEVATLLKGAPGATAFGTEVSAAAIDGRVPLALDALQCLERDMFEHSVRSMRPRLLLERRGRTNIGTIEALGASGARAPLEVSDVILSPT